MRKRYHPLDILSSTLALIGEYGFYHPIANFFTHIGSLIEWGGDRMRTSSPETQPSFRHYLDMSREDLEVSLAFERRTSTGDGRIEILAWRGENLDERPYLHSKK